MYLDDIIIGFAERGEVSTGAPTNTSTFISNPASYKDDINVGNYQLEIRRGTDYHLATALFNSGTIDTNDRLANKITVTIPDGNTLFDGQKFQLSDGARTATFEFEDLDLSVGDPNFGIAPGTAAVPNFAVGFRATESGATIAARLRTLLNSTAVRNALDITAATADGSVTGNSGNSNEVNLFGSIVADTAGDVSSSAFNIAGSLNFENYANVGAHYLYTGDQNAPRVQGSVQISQNKIVDSAQSGIVVNDNQRITSDSSDTAIIGVPQQLPITDPNRLTRGIKIVNNVIAGFTDAGINLTGDNNSGSGPLAAVPFHRIINNTIFGGLTPQGTGVRIQDSSPTLINNIIANTQKAIDLVGDVAQSTVVSHGLYQNNTQPNDIDGPFAFNYPNTLPLFVDPGTDNFYLAPTPQGVPGAIDSAANGFEDRPEIVQVANSIGIPQSNLLAPEIDRYGQQRIDDPFVATPPGLGNKVFLDRGAVERVDFAGPTSSIVSPQDGTVDPRTLVPPQPVDPTADLDYRANSVRLINQTVRQFIIGLDDTGIGVDD